MTKGSLYVAQAYTLSDVTHLVCWLLFWGLKFCIMVMIFGKERDAGKDILIECLSTGQKQAGEHKCIILTDFGFFFFFFCLDFSPDKLWSHKVTKSLTKALI